MYQATERTRVRRLPEPLELIACGLGFLQRFRLEDLPDQRLSALPRGILAVPVQSG